MVIKLCQIIADLCIVVDRPYLPITFLLQVGKLLLYKKVKFIGMVCLPTIHRCLKSVHRLPESNKLLTWIKRILPFKAYSTLHTNKSVQQQGGSYNKHNFQLQNFTYKKLSILKNLDFCWGSFKVELTHVTAQEYPQGIFVKLTSRKILNCSRPQKIILNTMKAPLLAAALTEVPRVKPKSRILSWKSHYLFYLFWKKDLDFCKLLSIQGQGN